MTDPRERWLVAVRDRLPLTASLAALRVASWLAVGGGWSAGQDLRLDGAASRRWRRRAWWGRDASHAVRARLDDPLRRASVERRILASHEALEALRRTPFLVGAHVGPSQAAAHVVARECPRALFAFWHSHPGLGAREYLMKGGEARRLSLAAFAAELRRGGQLFATADAGWRHDAIELPFLGGRVRLGRWAARLARRTGVAARPVAAVWQGGRIRIHVGAPLQPAAVDEPGWLADWLGAYLAFVEPLVRDAPENLRLAPSGLWGSLEATARTSAR